MKLEHEAQRLQPQPGTRRLVQLAGRMPGDVNLTGGWEIKQAEQIKKR